MAEDLRTRHWAWRDDPRTAVRTAVLWEGLDALVAQRREAVGRRSLRIIDLGGGTGGFAVPLAQLGHQITVLDPSPDALAALQRRANESGVGERITALQADAVDIATVVPAGEADLVLCHGVLEYVDDPAQAMGAALGTLAPGGFASLLVAQRLGAVLARALSGLFGAAIEALTDPDGRVGDADPLLRRFDLDTLTQLAADHGGTIVSASGIRWITDLLPGALVDTDAAAMSALVTLERLAAADPQLSALAAQLHVVVRV